MTSQLDVQMLLWRAGLCSGEHNPTHTYDPGRLRAPDVRGHPQDRQPFVRYEKQIVLWDFTHICRAPVLEARSTRYETNN